MRIPVRPKKNILCVWGNKNARILPFLDVFLSDGDFQIISIKNLFLNMTQTF